MAQILEGMHSTFCLTVFWISGATLLPQGERPNFSLTKIGNCTAKCLLFILYLTFIYSMECFKKLKVLGFMIFFFWSTSCQSWISRVGVQAQVNITVVRTCVLRVHLHWMRANTKAEIIMNYISLSLSVSEPLGSIDTVRLQKRVEFLPSVNSNGTWISQE